MTKGKMKCFSIIFFVLVLMIVGISTVFAAEKPITLTLAVYDNSTGLQGQHFTMLQEAIEKKTNAD